MGLYSDYGRFMKARSFKSFCNSGAGIWFCFSAGSSKWDSLLPDSEGVYRPIVPPSSPAAYTPLYRWIQSYKSSVQPQEFSLIDRTYILTDQYPSDQYIQDHPSLPISQNSPGYNFYNQSTQTLESHIFDPSNPIDPYYPSPSLPTFSVSYQSEWEPRVQSYIESSFDESTPEPSDPSEFESYSYNHHILKGKGRYIPLGLFSMIKGQAFYVEPVEESSNSLKTFKYGQYFWRVVPESEISNTLLPRHILLTASVFPNDLSLSSIVEHTLPVRQCSVFKFPDSLSSTLGGSTPRSSQVIRRENLNIVWSNPDTGEEINRVEEEGIINIPYNALNPLLSPSITQDSAELLINDHFIARKKDVMQTDRYGYIIGF